MTQAETILEIDREYSVKTLGGDYRGMRYVGREIEPIDPKDPRHVFAKPTTPERYRVLLISDEDIFNHDQRAGVFEAGGFGFKSFELKAHPDLDPRCWSKEELDRLNRIYSK